MYTQFYVKAINYYWCIVAQSHLKKTVFLFCLDGMYCCDFALFYYQTEYELRMCVEFMSTDFTAFYNKLEKPHYILN